MPRSVKISTPNHAPIFLLLLQSLWWSKPVGKTNKKWKKPNALNKPARFSCIMFETQQQSLLGLEFFFILSKTIFCLFDPEMGHFWANLGT